MAPDVSKLAEGRGVNEETISVTAPGSTPNISRKALAEIRIGVTGHRFLVEIERVRDGVIAALDYIQAQFPRAKYTVISSLAEGADRLVAEEALARKMMLVVPLPLAKTLYMQDFATQESREEFTRLLRHTHRLVELPVQSTRVGSYELAAQYVLENCDVLLAVWDGLAEQGVGGTGSTVRRARQLGVPIAWVHAGNRKSGTTVPISLGDEQGVVSFEEFDDPLRCDCSHPRESDCS